MCLPHPNVSHTVSLDFCNSNRPLPSMNCPHWGKVGLESGSSGCGFNSRHVLYINSICFLKFSFNHLQPFILVPSLCMQNFVKMQKPATGKMFCLAFYFCCQYISRMWTQCPGVFVCWFGLVWFGFGLFAFICLVCVGDFIPKQPNQNWIPNNIRNIKRRWLVCC